MLTIPAKTVYVDPRVYDKANCRERLERVLKHVACTNIRELDEKGLEEFNAVGSRRHGKDNFGDDAVLAFTTFEPEKSSWYYHFRDKAVEGGGHNGVCQSALELNLINGCVFRCAYCGFGRRIHFALDVEQFVDGLDDVFARYPDQRLYKYSNMTDLPPFEPELDAVPPVIRRFAEEEGRYVMLFTKSDNVDYMLDLDHKGQTIVSWTLTCDTASRLIDRRAPSLDERIEAMRKCHEAGYHVRARLSPVVPVKNWREEYTELFQKLFATTKPDMVTLELLGWFDVTDLHELMDTDLLDQELLAEAEGAADELAGIGWRPYTERAHEEVYRHCINEVKRISPNTPVAVCHGSANIWKALGSEMGMSPECYICNCGPTSTPGNPIYDKAAALR